MDHKPVSRLWLRSPLFNGRKGLAWLAAVLFLAASAYLACGLHGRFASIETAAKDNEQDIYFAWVEGQRLIHGSNPYARILAGDGRTNNKYATYFPGFYLLSALSQLAGLRLYPDWIAFWRKVFLGFHLAVAAVLFLAPARKSLALSAFGAGFWLFNRWTLNVAAIAHLDPVALFFLVLSLCLLRKQPALSMLAFSLSLGIKQIAVFLVPLYVIWAWNEGPRKDAPKRAARAFGLAASIPLVLSAPFLIWDPVGYCRSILFSVTRFPESHFRVLSLDFWLCLVGIPARLPMLGLMGLIYWLLLKRAIGPMACALLVMLVFLDFNPVVFTQYMIWIVPLAPLAAWEWLDRGRPASASSVPSQS